jgi:hypothetical protein
MKAVEVVPKLTPDVMSRIETVFSAPPEAS